MPSSPSHNHKHKSSHKDKHNRSRYQTAHYGAHRQLHRDQQRTSSYSLLLDLPTESLTHVTAFLDPPSLFSLAQTCKSLYRHVGDDNTWRRAFFYQFLGVHPESTLDPQESARDGTMLMLRREEVNWKREFVARWNLRRCVYLRPSAVQANSLITSFYIPLSQTMGAYTVIVDHQPRPCSFFRQRHLFTRPGHPRCSCAAHGVPHVRCRRSFTATNGQNFQRLSRCLWHTQWVRARQP